MDSTSLLSPALLHAVAIFLLALTILMVAVHSGMIALAARGAAVSPRARWMAPAAAAAVLAAWAGWAILAVRDPVAVPEPPPVARPPILLLDMLVPLMAAVLVLLRSRSMRAITTATPPAWLIAVQTYRVAGVLFFWPFLASGALPWGFALPAGIGDFLTGIAAPFVAWAIARGHPRARVWAVAWNLFGLLDLVAAPAAAVIAHAPNIARFPLVIVPLFLGPPLGILTHLRSLLNLSTAFSSRPAARSST